MTTLCDYPGCHRQATNITHAQGANTPAKEWRSCNRHKAERDLLDRFLKARDAEDDS